MYFSVWLYEWHFLEVPILSHALKMYSRVLPYISYFYLTSREKILECVHTIIVYLTVNFLFCGAYSRAFS